MKNKDWEKKLDRVDDILAENVVDEAYSWYASESDCGIEINGYIVTSDEAYNKLEHELKYYILNLLSQQRKDIVKEIEKKINILLEDNHNYLLDVGNIGYPEHQEKAVESFANSLISLLKKYGRR